MNAHIEKLRKALNGELEAERQRENQKSWKWAKANDPVLTQMLLDARDFKKNGDPMINRVTVRTNK